jgi:hypothetical protein
MSNGLDIDAIIARFRERADAWKKRNLPPVGGDERKAFIQQAEQDFLDYALIADETHSLEDGILTLSINLGKDGE